MNNSNENTNNMTRTSKSARIDDELVADLMREMHKLVLNTEDNELCYQHVIRANMYRMHIRLPVFNNATPYQPDPNKCYPTMDSYKPGVRGCWPATPFGHVAYSPCEQTDPAPTGRAVRMCLESGDWSNVTDRSQCAGQQATHLIVMHYIYFVGYIVSVAMLLAAVLIFLKYKKLRCLRNLVHTNLIVAFMLRNMTYLLFVAGRALSTWIHNDTFEKFNCAVGPLLLKYFICCTFFWMFVEGLCLFVVIMFSYNSEKIRLWMCSLIGWGIPLCLFLTHLSISIAKKRNLTTCDTADSEFMIYIYSVPIFIVLIMNVIFLCVIVCVVMRKLRLTTCAEWQRYRKGARALLFLCPLLGMNYLLTFIAPNVPWLKTLIGYYSAVISSTHGALVAYLFCLRNKEVRESLRGSTRRTVDQVHSKHWLRLCVQEWCCSSNRASQSTPSIPYTTAHEQHNMILQPITTTSYLSALHNEDTVDLTQDTDLMQDVDDGTHFSMAGSEYNYDQSEVFYDCYQQQPSDTTTLYSVA